MFSLLILHSFIFSLIKADQLEYVSTLWRHGDRAPEGGYSSPSIEKLFPYGKGQLTKRGIENSIDLGKRLREMYVESGFLNATYQHHEVHIKSIDIPRCISSAISVGQGMFTDERLGFPFPVPVRSQRFDEDYTLTTPFNHCAPLSDVYGELCPGLDVRKYENYNSFERDAFLCSPIQKKNKVFRTKEAFKLADSLTNEYFNGISPNVDEVTLSEALNTTRMVRNFMQGSYPYTNLKLTKSYVGQLLHEILNAMVERQQCKPNSDDTFCQKKFQGFSTQDYIINMLLETLGAKKEVLGCEHPNYTAALSIEMWRRESGMRYVKTFYRYGANVNEGKFIEVTKNVNGCHNKIDCTFDSFYSSNVVNSHPSGREYCKSENIRRRRSRPNSQLL